MRAANCSGLSSKSRRRKSGPPVFKSEQGRWSIGSEVVAFWWETRKGDAVQLHDVGIVARLHQEGNGEGPRKWWATVTWGPLLDLVRPTVFDPAELLAAAPYDPEDALHLWGQNGR